MALVDVWVMMTMIIITIIAMLCSRCTHRIFLYTQIHKHTHTSYYNIHKWQMVIQSPSIKRVWLKNLLSTAYQMKEEYKKWWKFNGIIRFAIRLLHFVIYFAFFPFIFFFLYSLFISIQFNVRSSLVSQEEREKCFFSVSYPVNPIITDRL